MTSIVGAALRLRSLVLALAVLVLIAGVQTAGEMPQDVFPEFAPPLVEIQTEAPGLSTEEVEALVTVPLESVLNGAPWVTTVRSKSVPGLSSIVLLFAEGTDLLAARQVVQERLGAAAAGLPTVAAAPRMLPPLSATSRVLALGLSSPTLSQTALSELMRWTIRPRLLAVAGVANVTVWGDQPRQVHVLIEPDRLRTNGVTLDDVVRAATDAATVASGGFVESPAQRLAVRQHGATTAGDVAASLVPTSTRGAQLRLGDVATVREGAPPPIGDAVVGSGAGLFVVVEQQPWGNVLGVTRGIEDALAGLRSGLGDVRIDTIFRPASFVEQSLRALGRSMLIGAILVAAVLLAFLLDWRSAMISVLAIPLSLVGAVLCLHALGYGLNVMVLAGLTIAVGEVVDDAIVDVENIVRRLRVNRTLPAPEPARSVVLRASVEVRSAIIHATAIVVLVFVPVLVLPGLAGAFFRPLAMAYILAIICSLATAATVTPVLALILLGNRDLQPTRPRVVERLEHAYARALEAMLGRRRVVTGVLAGSLLATLVVLPFLGEEFLPEFQERDFLMHWVGVPSTSLAEIKRTAARAGSELLEVPGVRAVGAHIGRAEGGDEVVGANFAELWLRVGEEVDLADARRHIQAIIDGYPGLQRDVLTYLRERIKEVLTGAKAAIVVRIYGQDLAPLRTKAEEVRAAIQDVPGIADLMVEQQTMVPQIEVRMRPEAAALAGLTAGELRRAVGTVVAGTRVGELYDGARSVGVVVWSDAGSRTDLQALRGLPLTALGGGVTRLGDVAEVRVAAAPNEIKREGGSRRIDVVCNARGRDSGAVAREVAARVQRLGFGAGQHAEVIGEHAARTAARQRLVLLSALALIGIAVVLQTDFQSLRLTTLVLVTLPFATVGGVAAALLGGGVLSLGSLVGFVTVLGIAARNGILLVSHYRQLSDEGVPFGPELALRGATERLTPILMTALSAGLALVPLVAAGALPGHEIERPMAAVILGGLATSTILNLFIVPTLYLAFGRAELEGDGTSSA